MTDATAAFWAERWKDCLAPPADAELRAARLARDLDRFEALRDDIAFVDAQLEQLLADSAGQVLTSAARRRDRPRGRVRRAHAPDRALPDARNTSTPRPASRPPAMSPRPSASAAAISRTGLPEHRDALMGIAWGLGQFAPAFQRRRRELNARGMTGIQARVALARHACRLCWRLLHTQQPYDDRRYDRARRDRGR